MNTISNKLNVIDLFCGCGGLAKGLTDALKSPRVVFLEDISTYIRFIL